jgi:hypothetical protein
MRRGMGVPSTVAPDVDMAFRPRQFLCRAWTRDAARREAHRVGGGAPARAAEVLLPASATDDKVHLRAGWQHLAGTKVL